ncbi:glycosyltransferase family 4 protein [Alcaligenes sp. SDU_A2]|uniref:glycosyltransferase family 4 protein n=1 Tax=Alcaligenes sp. SDU_A2 TaxID=3136634 RepID=UPI0031203AF7
MKIAYIITRSDVIGGANIHLLDLAQGIKKEGIEAIILIGGEGIVAQEANAKGIPTLAIKNLIREINLIKDILAFFEIRSALKKISPDIVHLHSSKAGIVGRLAARSLGLPAIFTAHGWAFTDGVSKRRKIAYRLIEKAMAPFATKIITVSEYDRQLAIKNKIIKPSKLRAIQNGLPDVDIEKKYLEHQETQNDHLCKLIMVARFDEQKDQATLIKALALIKNKNWNLTFAGDGRLRSEAEKLVKEHQLTDKIIFAGACRDIPDRLQASDVFVLSTNWEGFPLSILEAMRAGLPVLATDVGGVSEAVAHGVTGYLSQRGDSQELAKYLELLISDPKLRESLGKNGQISFKKNFTFKTMLEKTISVYKDALKI